ncbi:CypD family RiPP peptide-cysteine decarboxylase [Microbacterium rhizomatis]|uniref:CypD family RiPP peptide-cysteine decarboxylase n=1 Tax=Microbacterium rhizomatis TaxID=1631477 RepID=A0A5J5IZB8_9MICO|nr:CypD family RiPP peptide-cysteine decarboxylase [Microbacterium rhizomatis]KAA9104505.1 CypD family RiPP peptide-cysteine decarboxylase [Microbacterium rhizomatis]
MTADQQPPTFAGSELHIHVSGSISASLVPWWIHWLRYTNPDVVVNLSVSENAHRFVSVDALDHLANGEVWSDSWSSPSLTSGWRLGRTGRSQCIIVFPATLDTVMRLSQGRADSPALMMMQITKLPIVIAEVSPAENEVTKYWREILLSRSNVSFAPEVEGTRADDRSMAPNGFNFPGALAVANAALSTAERR